MMEISHICLDKGKFQMWSFPESKLHGPTRVRLQAQASPLITPLRVRQKRNVVQFVWILDSSLFP